MKLIPLQFKKLGNHWYLDIEHENPKDLLLDVKIEKLFNRLDSLNTGVINNVYLEEVVYLEDNQDLLQFNDNDLLRYFTSSESFTMNVFIGKHLCKFSSNLYTLLESKYKADFHVTMYQFKFY